MRISLSHEASADFEAAIDWYLEELAFAAADDFADEFEHALALLGTFPEMGVTSQYKTRAFTLPKFPYSLIYRVLSDHIRIIAVAHHSRRPGYWAARR
ncbi:MAG: type II toxin-antitoxin system RelE/ParE family toxin [Porticoccaceae bacterium]